MLKIKIYISRKSSRTTDSVNRLIQYFESTSVKASVSVINILEDPAQAADDDIIATPTLIKVGLVFISPICVSGGTPLTQTFILLIGDQKAMVDKVRTKPIKVLPEPQRRVLGNLSNPSKIAAALKL